MACGCKRGTTETTQRQMDLKSGYVLVRKGLKTKPTDICIACAQKHYDEAWIAFNECGYSDENRRFIRGSLRAIVLHTYKEWAEIGNLARECALLIQEGKDKEAIPKMEQLGSMIDAEFYRVNPEIKERIEELKRRADDTDINSIGRGEQEQQ